MTIRMRLEIDSPMYMGSCYFEWTMHLGNIWLFVLTTILVLPYVTDKSEFILAVRANPPIFVRGNQDHQLITVLPARCSRSRILR